MKLLAIEMSRLTALFQVSRTAGQMYMPQAVLMTNGRYNFSSYPHSYEELSRDRIDFKHGEFEGSAIESLEIYNDGIVISSKSDTNFIDNFFADFCHWIAEDLGLSMIKTHSIDMIYDSTLIFEAENKILKPLETISEIGQLIEKDLKENSNLEVIFEPFGWGLAADQTQNPALKPVSFRVERRIGTDYSLKQFISTAPLKTKQHIDILNKLETLF